VAEPAVRERSQSDLARIESVDLLCERFLEHAAPLTFRTAERSERDAIFRLRYECVIEKGWARPEDYPDGLERDAYDDDAVHVTAWEGDGLAGTVRLVFPAPGRRFPIEEEFGLRLERPEEVVDGGRLVVAPGYRGDSGHQVLTGLFAQAWVEARKRGLDVFAAVAPPGVIKLYRQVGFDITVLGSPRPYWGEERAPILISGADPEAVERTTGMGG
jgi:N-acyl-L-homoserine lactone synthetase